MKIASLLPSATEMICAVGARAELVGVSHECDFPADVIGLPILTCSKVALPKRSGEIDRDIRQLLTDALGVYDINVDLLRELAPDVIVTQDLCDVCAVSFDDVCKAAQSLGNPDLKIVNLHPNVLQDIWTDIIKVGRALDREDAAYEACGAMDERLAEVKARAEHLPKPNVLTIEWIDPVMIGGTWMPELVQLAGGAPLVTEPGQHAPTLSIGELKDLDPDVVVIKPCGFDIPRTLQEQDALRTLLQSMSWPAVRDGRVFIADGNAFFNRPGPRIVDSLEIMAACVHPEEFADLAERHSGGFIRLPLG